jgi:hypothetical protein
VPLSGVAAYDPFGDQHEHDEDVALATDGNTGTFLDDRALPELHQGRCGFSSSTRGLPRSSHA